LQPKIAKIKNPYFRSSGSFKVNDVDMTEKLESLVLVVIGSVLMPICNHFHESLANNGKITTFTGVLLFDACFLKPRKSRLLLLKSTLALC